MSDAAAALPRKQNRSSEELEMRALIVPRLRAQWPDARIVHELPLRYSTNRIDLAAIRPSEIIAVEIKSSRDTNERLEAQLRAFAPISSRIIVALAPKWNENLEGLTEKIAMRGGGLATQYTPRFTETQAIVNSVKRWHPWIETWTVDSAAGAVEVTDPLYSRANGQPWLAQMLHMLHVDELKMVAARHQVSAGIRPTHWTLYQQCSAMMTGREIVGSVCAMLRSRGAFGADSDPPVDASEWAAWKPRRPDAERLFA